MHEQGPIYLIQQFSCSKLLGYFLITFFGATMNSEVKMHYIAAHCDWELLIRPRTTSGVQVGIRGLTWPSTACLPGLNLPNPLRGLLEGQEAVNPI